MRVHSRRSGSVRLVLALAGAALSAAAGCEATMKSFHDMPGMGERDTRPTLAEVRVLGPNGRKCYDFCASAEAACKEMCPDSTVGECRDDCVTDTKGCLEDCPELQRPVPPPKP